METYAGTVRTVGHVFELLEIMADAGGDISLSNLAALAGRPPSSVYRLLQTCKIGGFVRQLPSHRYALGASLIPLGECAGRQLAQVAQPRLRFLVAQLGETASIAILEGDHAVYVAQQPSPHAMRMVTEAGRQATMHATAVGKAILATMTESAVRGIIGRTGMAPYTPYTLITPETLLDDLATTRTRGYALDDEEEELGVRCFAVAVPKTTAHIAIAVSAPLVRIRGSFRALAVQELQLAAAQIADDLPI